MSISSEEEDLPEYLEGILVGDSSKPKDLGINLHPKIESRLKYWTEKGLKASEREELLQKYKRSKDFDAPKVNAAIKAKLSAKKHDSFRVEAQNSVRSALKTVGVLASTLIAEPDCIDVLDSFEILFEAFKILASAFYQ